MALSIVITRIVLTVSFEGGPTKLFGIEIPCDLSINGSHTLRLLAGPAYPINNVEWQPRANAMYKVVSATSKGLSSDHQKQVLEKLKKDGWQEVCIDWVNVD